MILIFGYKTPSRQEAGTLLYAGSDGDEALKAIEENADTYPRIGRLDHPNIRTVQHFDENHPAAKQMEERVETFQDPTLPDENAGNDLPEKDEVTSEPKPKRSRK